MAAPFTAGISLGLTIAGIGSGLAGFSLNTSFPKQIISNFKRSLGGITSAGANLTGYFLLKNALNMLKTELKEHNLKIEKLKDLINDSSYLRKAIRLRPTLCQLGPIILLPLIIFSYILG